MATNDEGETIQTVIIGEQEFIIYPTRPADGIEGEVPTFPGILQQALVANGSVYLKQISNDVDLIRLVDNDTSGYWSLAIVYPGSGSDVDLHLRYNGATMVVFNHHGKINLLLASMPIYANNAAALAGALVAGQLYRTGGDPDAVCIVH
jgi:hypothetical protein